MKKLILLFSLNLFLFAQYSQTKIETKLHEATLIYKVTSTKKAVLYIHGYNDYFFHDHLAYKFVEKGYSFYALDLHGYGRSKKNNSTDMYMSDVSDYFDEINLAIEFIKAQGADDITLFGHSQGGLIGILFEDKYRAFNRVVLNSPFLDFNAAWYEEGLLIPILSLAGYFFPQYMIDDYREDLYDKHLYQIWGFDAKKKMITYPSKHLGWFRAISNALETVQAGLSIKVPILVLHSDKTGYSKDDIGNSDMILDVEEIEEYSKQLGLNVTTYVAKGALHDIFLSKRSIRDKARDYMFNWLAKN